MLTLQRLPQMFAVCKITSPAAVDFSAPFVFLSKTDDELSLVCEASAVPPDALACEPDWRALKIVGQLDFGMVGVIAKISAVLADQSISLFVISTYNTDYVLVKAAAFDTASSLLSDAGYAVI